MTFHVSIVLWYFFYFRVLVSHVERFMSDAPTVMWHIPHKFSKQMSEKSTTISQIV